MEAPSVEKEHRLLAVLKGLAKKRAQLCADLILALGDGAPHIRDTHGRQGCTRIAMGKGNECIFSAHRLAIALDGGCRGCHDEKAVMRGNSVLGDISCVIFGGHIGFVRRFLLLVDDDESDIGKGREYSRACAEHNIDIASADALIRIKALAVGKP